MNYNSDKTVGFTVREGKLDINGNKLRYIDFYKQVDGTWTKYKTARTNEYLGQATADQIVKIWG